MRCDGAPRASRSPRSRAHGQVTLRCSIPGCPHTVDRAAGGSRAVFAGREVYLCTSHTAQARGALVGAARGLKLEATRRFPGIALALEAATKFYRATQVPPDAAPVDEPIFVEAKVVR